MCLGFRGGGDENAADLTYANTLSIVAKADEYLGIMDSSVVVREKGQIV